MIVGSDIVESSNSQDMIDFYKTQFESVSVASCGKCGQELALIMFGGDPMGMQVNELGQVVLPMSSKLISHRVRLDEAPTGEQMVGFQCECGNDTRISKIEEEYLPQGPQNSAPTSLDPFTKHRIREAIKLRKDHKPKFKMRDNIKTFETFKVKRIK